MGGATLRAAVAIAAALVLAGPSSGLAANLPRAVITAGPAGEVEETTATFTFEATSSAPLSRFECRLDAAEWRVCTSPATYEGLTGGPHRFEVRLTGLLVDSTPDVRAWTVAVRTEVTPAPLPPPPPPPVPPVPSPEAERRDAGNCAYGHNRPGEVADARLERATVCLVNRERARRGLRRVVRRQALERTAAAHAADMVDRRYFSHISASGASVGDRARRAGYLDGTDWWTVGEVLAWSRPSVSPWITVRAWMRSRGHRAVLLGASYRDVGLSIAHGTPRGHRLGATYVGVLGRRG